MSRYLGVGIIDHTTYKLCFPYITFSRYFHPSYSSPAVCCPQTQSCIFHSAVLQIQSPPVFGHSTPVERCMCVGWNAGHKGLMREVRKVESGREVSREGYNENVPTSHGSDERCKLRSGVRGECSRIFLHFDIQATSSDTFTALWEAIARVCYLVSVCLSVAFV